MKVCASARSAIRPKSAAFRTVRSTNSIASHSVAKSIVALAVAIALQEGKIASLDDRADVYAPKLQGTLYGETTIKNLLRMASGARFTEIYDGKDDAVRFSATTSQEGLESAARIITERAHPQGTHFNYASAETAMLGAVLRGATGVSVSSYLESRLWQPTGAETSGLVAHRTNQTETGRRKFQRHTP